DGRVLWLQGGGLVVFVVGVRDEPRREPIERQLAVWLRILDRPECRRGLERGVVGVVAERPRRFALEDVRVDSRVRDPAPKPPAERRANIADAVELVPEPRLP